MNDVWILNLDSLTWQLIATSAKPLPPVGGGQFDAIEAADNEPLLGRSESAASNLTAALPPSAGHVQLAWGSTLLCIGGHTKAGTYSHLRKVFTTCLPAVRVIAFHVGKIATLHDERSYILIGLS